MTLTLTVDQQRLLIDNLRASWHTELEAALAAGDQRAVRRISRGIKMLPSLPAAQSADGGTSFAENAR